MATKLLGAASIIRSSILSPRPTNLLSPLQHVLSQPPRCPQPGFYWRLCDRTPTPFPTLTSPGGLGALSMTELAEVKSSAVLPKSEDHSIGTMRYIQSRTR